MSNIVCLFFNIRKHTDSLSKILYLFYVFNVIVNYKYHLTRCLLIIFNHLKTHEESMTTISTNEDTSRFRNSKKSWKYNSLMKWHRRLIGIYSTSYIQIFCKRAFYKIYDIIHESDVIEFILHIHWTVYWIFEL